MLQIRIQTSLGPIGYQESGMTSFLSGVLFSGFGLSLMLSCWQKEAESMLLIRQWFSKRWIIRFFYPNSIWDEMTRRFWLKPSRHARPSDAKTTSLLVQVFGFGISRPFYGLGTYTSQEPVPKGQRAISSLPHRTRRIAASGYSCFVLSHPLPTNNLAASRVRLL